MACTTCGKSSLLGKATNIVKGFYNKIVTDPIIESIAEPRLRVCYDCPKSKIVIKIGDMAVRKCTECGCFIEEKARVKEETCPIGNW